jgi:hypothetical protein
MVSDHAQLATWLRTGGGSEPVIPATSAGWEQFAGAACKAGLAGLILEAASRRGIDLPVQVAAKLRHRATIVAAHNLNLIQKLQELLPVFRRAGTPVLLLKGAALNLTVYARPDLRPMSDLDLLIQPWAVRRTFALLEECGYRRGFDLVRADFFPTYHYEVEFLSGSSRPVRIDLHARPFRPLRISRTMPDDALWKDPLVVRCGEAQALMPRPELMFIHLAAHAAFHGCSRVLWLYDIERFALHYADSIDWSEVAALAGRWRLSLPVLRAVTHASELLGAVVPPSFIDELKTHKTGWRDRLTLAQAPRDAGSPIRHVLVNWMCTPGIRFGAGYLLAHLLPGREHLRTVYPFRHRGWMACAHTWRVVRSVGRALLGPFHGLLRRAADRTSSVRPARTS